MRTVKSKDRLAKRALRRTQGRVIGMGKKDWDHIKWKYTAECSRVGKALRVLVLSFSAFLSYPFFNGRKVAGRHAGRRTRDSDVDRYVYAIHGWFAAQLEGFCLSHFTHMHVSLPKACDLSSFSTKGVTYLELAPHGFRSKYSIAKSFQSSTFVLSEASWRLPHVSVYQDLRITQPGVLIVKQLSYQMQQASK